MTLASTLLSRDSNGHRPRVTTVIYGRNSLFQQRDSFISRTSRELERVGGIVVDVSLRLNRRVLDVVRPPNSNVVQLTFIKSMVRHMHVRI